MVQRFNATPACLRPFGDKLLNFVEPDAAKLTDTQTEGVARLMFATEYVQAWQIPQVPA